MLIPGKYLFMDIIDTEILYDHKRLIDALENGLDPNTKIYQRIPIISYWIRQSNEEITLLLLENGADINSIDEYDKETLLQLATLHNLPILVTKLLKKGMDPNFTHCTSNPVALYIAASNGSDEIIKILLDYGASVDTPSYAKETALMAAAVRGHYLATEILIKAGADVNSYSLDGHTPLIHAGIGGYVSIAKLLINNNAKPLTRDNDNRNATDHARHHFDPVLAQGFRDLGIPDMYNIDELLSIEWEPDSLYDVFISYKQDIFSEDVDEIRKKLMDKNISVFVDRYDLHLDNYKQENIDIVKEKLRRSVNNSSLLLFFEMHWDGSLGEPTLSSDNLNWQYFELLHSKKTVLVSVDRKCCDELIVVPGKRLESKSIFGYQGCDELIEKILTEVL